MNIGSSGSLAEAFIQNAEAKENYRKENPACRVINNYIISVNAVNDTIRCAVGNQCEWFAAQGDEKGAMELQNLIFCVSCNRIYHLKCAAIDIKSVTEDQLPWLWETLKKMLTEVVLNHNGF